MKLTISWFAHAKIMHWIKKADTKECSGFGMIQKLDGHLHVTDAFLIEQVNTGGDTEMKPEAIAKEMYLRREEKGEMNFWWHSHHSMSAYMSGTDVSTIKELGANGWLLATVFNNKDEHKSVLYIKNSGFGEMYLDGFALEVTRPPLSNDAKKFCDEEFKEKVSEKKYVYPTGREGGWNEFGYGGWRGDDDWESPLKNWVFREEGWTYIGIGAFTESFPPPMPHFLKNGIKDGIFKYNEEKDNYQLVPYEQRKKTVKAAADVERMD